MLVPKITDDKYNIQLSSTGLLSCQQVNQVFMCDLFGVMYKTFEGSPVHAEVQRGPKNVQLQGGACRKAALISLGRGILSCICPLPPLEILSARMELTPSYIFPRGPNK
jgi:hypothetical protein